MEFSITQLLEAFSDHKLVAPKALEKKLGINEDSAEVKKLQVALDALEKIGILEKDKGRYRQISEEGVVEGRLRCSSKGFCFAIQDTEGAEDIYIRESRLSNAWNGDRVLVRVTKDGIRRRSPEGEVRLIIERSNPTLLAKVKPTETSYQAIPLDDRLLFEIDLVPNEEVPDLSVAVDKLIHLEMVRYPLGNHLPIGKVVQVLGNDAESTNDIDLVCCKHNLPRKFSDKVLAAAASLPKAVRKADLKHRLDLHKATTIRIGNAAAISLVPSKSGWDLGVHIPDVATYVTEGSELDLAARRRLRSFYLGDMTVPMLPEIEALNQLEYLTVSVLMKLDREGLLTSFEIQPSAISLRAKLSYEEAQEMSTAAGKEDVDVAMLIGNIERLGTLLLQQRSEAFQIKLPQAYTYDPDEGTQGVPVVPANTPIYGMVAEIMIVANQAIASHLTALSLPTIFRTQSPPDQNKVSDWLKLLESMGVTLGLNEAEPPQHPDYQRFLAQIEQMPQPTHRDILNYLLLSLLKPGEYSLTQGSHFGLALTDKPYIHGVMPMHRYADLLIQRVLHAVFTEGRDRRTTRSKEGVDLRSSSCHGEVGWGVLPPDRERQLAADMEFVVVRLSQQDALAHRVKSDLEGLQKAEFMQAHTGKNFFGIITGVQSYGFFVEIESLLVEGLVHVSSLKDDWYEFPQTNSRTKARASTVLVGRRSGRQYSLGDRVEVQVKSVDYYRQQIDLVAVVSGEAVDNYEHNSDSPYPEDFAEEELGRDE